MTEPTWSFLFFDLERDKWLEVYKPTFDQVARLRAWRASIETEGFAPGTVVWEDEDFVARVPGSRIVVAGIAVPFEGLLIVNAVMTLRVSL